MEHKIAKVIIDGDPEAGMVIVHAQDCPACLAGIPPDDYELPEPPIN